MTKKSFTFSVKNLGVIESGSFTQKPLMLFCGPNHTGKTWAMYSLWLFYDFCNAHRRNINDEKSEDLITDLKGLNKVITGNLPALFNDSYLEKAKFELVENSFSMESLLAETACNCFLIPSERSGLHLFFRELSTRRTALLHHASKDKINIQELLRDVIRSRYAMPIAKYINWLNASLEQRAKPSEEFYPFSVELEKNIVKGKYKVNWNTGEITFKPYQTRGGKATEYLKLHITSGTVKSLFGLWFYLKYQAKTGDVLMIDEPELNIHPKNQIEIARLLGRLVNAGIHVVISTHSDYIVREFNSLIMLNKDKGNKVGKKYSYGEKEALTPEKVSAYLFNNKAITPFEITPDDGIYATTFEETIERQGDINDDIYYSLKS